LIQQDQCLFVVGVWEAGQERVAIPPKPYDMLPAILSETKKQKKKKSRPDW